MLTVNDLMTIESLPHERDVSLDLYRQFYKQNLCDRIFVFELGNDEEIKFVFAEDNFWHLIGLDHIMPGHEYEGQTGYDMIANGIVTLQSLRKRNRDSYGSKKLRILYFPFLYQMIHSPVLIDYKPISNSRMRFDFIFYNVTDGRYLHLGLRKGSGKDANSEFLYPISFFEDRSDKYISDQTPIQVIHVRVEKDIPVKAAPC